MTVLSWDPFREVAGATFMVPGASCARKTTLMVSFFVFVFRKLSKEKQPLRRGISVACFLFH
jgi:hypothetical protein